MPPESFDGVVSPAWDVWSLGVLLVEACTGNVPFAAQSEKQLMLAIAQGEPAIPPDLPAPLYEVARGCLVKDYRKRWSAAQIVERIHAHREAEHKREVQEKHERMARLKSLADEAAKSCNWDDASRLLGEARALDCTDPDIDARLADLEKRRTRDEGLRHKLAGAVAVNDYARARVTLAELAGETITGQTSVQGPLRRYAVLGGAMVTLLVVALAFLWILTGYSVPLVERDGVMIQTPYWNQIYKIVVPAGAEALTVYCLPTDPPAESDPDFGVRYGSKPRENPANHEELTIDECDSHDSNTDDCVFQKPRSGNWYVAVRSPDGDVAKGTLFYHVVANAIDLKSRAAHEFAISDHDEYFKVVVPAGSSRLTVHLLPKKGDSHLEIWSGSRGPAGSGTGCVSSSGAAAEGCSELNPAAGEWFARAWAYNAHTAVASIVASIETTPFEKATERIPEVDGVVESLRFYAPNPDNPAERVFQTVFPINTSIVKWELGWALQPTSQTKRFNVNYSVYRPSGVLMYEGDTTGSREGGAEHLVMSNNVDFRDRYEPGTYLVGFSIGGNRVASGRFDISSDNPPKTAR